MSELVQTDAMQTKTAFEYICMYIQNLYVLISIRTQSDNFFYPDLVLRQQHNDHPQQPEDQLLLPRKKEFLAPFWDK